jgi:hypothetical protein
MSNAIETREDYDLRLNSRHPAVAILQRHYVDTVELRSRIDHARNLIEAPYAARIQSLLAGLREELAVITKLLQERLASLSPDYNHLQRPHTESEQFWQLFRIDGCDCSGHLEALLSGYVRYARATSDSIALLQTLGDEESVQLMNTMFDAADRSIWFLEFYMEGLALRMDLERLPEFAPTIGI